MDILTTFNRNNNRNEYAIDLILILVGILIVRFNINNRRYAEPATHASIISIGNWLFNNIEFPEITVLKNKLNTA